jgi:hypothetical protein
VPDFVELTPGTKDLYKDREGANSFHTENDKKGGNFTLHHVLPYRYPFFAGWLLQQIFATGAMTKADWECRRLRTQIDNLCDAVLPGKVNFTEVLKDPKLGHKFAWMGANLFAGPSSSVRVDDPGSNPEPVKPQSFDPQRWEAVKAWDQTLKDAGIQLSGGDDPGSRASVTVTHEFKLFEGGQVLKLVQALVRLQAYGKEVHPYQKGDWIIIDIDDRDDNTYTMTTQQKIEYYNKTTQQNVVKYVPSKRPSETDSISGLKDAHRAAVGPKPLLVGEQLLSDKIMEFQPGDHRGVTFAGAPTPSYIVLWRLRLPNEKPPKHVMPGNFQFQ